MDISKELMRLLVKEPEYLTIFLCTGDAESTPHKEFISGLGLNLDKEYYHTILYELESFGVLKSDKYEVRLTSIGKDYHKEIQKRLESLFGADIFI